MGAAKHNAPRERWVDAPATRSDPLDATGTDGGPTPKSSRQYEVTTDVAVGQMRQIDFLGDEECDWAFRCHMSHHTMSAMGHDVPTMIRWPNPAIPTEVRVRKPPPGGSGGRSGH